jgi:RNA recognition motif-containing protein
MSMANLYVGNLPYGASEDDVQEMFRRHGTVQNVTLIRDKETGQSRGFCFVEMKANEAHLAIEALDGSEYEGHILRVNIARDRGAPSPRRQF